MTIIPLKCFAWALGPGAPFELPAVATVASVAAVAIGQARLAMSPWGWLEMPAMFGENPWKSWRKLQFYIV